ncbi:MAG: ribonuclease R [Desulfuromonas sp.]|nr:MAG: ribonuclease R [Desulfuromonas sp.]
MWGRFCVTGNPGVRNLVTDLKDILELFSRRANRPVSLKELQTEFDLNASGRREIGRILKGLVRDGSLVQLKGGRFALPDKVSLVVGTLSLHREGYGFVTPAKGGADLFVPARYVRPAMHGDRVVARMERGRRTGKPEGRVIRVEQRALRQVVGRYELGRGVGYLVPADPKLHDDLLIPPEASGGARPGQMVIAEITQYPERSRAALAQVVEVLGAPDDPQVEVRVAAVRFGLPAQFGLSCLKEARHIPGSVLETDWPGRRDLRQTPFVTIDGESAKDFDDAVAIETLNGHGYRLLVAIADVAHYVKPGSAIDREARERGTSVYFPGVCLPMLPESLSNGICSLNPDVERLVMVAQLDFDDAGRRTATSFYPAVIRSRARLTYSEVAAALVDKESQAVDRQAERMDDLVAMARLAKLRIQRRRERGSLDFDLPEADILLDLQGRPENIVRAERNLAHRLIEEFMMAANEAVASWLESERIPLVFRVHDAPSPEKLSAFQEFIAWFNQGIAIPSEGIKPGILQALLDRVGGLPEERVINHVLLRSLPQACYSTVNRGHFGLASDSYCHFTSPIRRYPDLLVHRILKQRLATKAGGKGPVDTRLEELAQQASLAERRAMEAERDIVNLKKCQFMAGKVGETFSGLVTSVQPFGFFVELEVFFVEGLVHVSTLEDDFYQYEEERHRLVGMNRRRIFEIGGEVEVLVHKVDQDRREIDFRLLDHESRPRSPGASRRPRPAHKSR